MISFTNALTAIKWVAFGLTVAFLLYVIVDVPTYRFYAIVFVANALAIKFQLWQYTPCDRARVRGVVAQRLRELERRVLALRTERRDASDESSSDDSGDTNVTVDDDRRQHRRRATRLPLNMRRASSNEGRGHYCEHAGSTPMHRRSPHFHARAQGAFYYDESGAESLTPKGMAGREVDRRSPYRRQSPYRLTESG